MGVAEQGMTQDIRKLKNFNKILEMLRSYGKYPGNHPKQTQTQVLFCKYYKIFKNTYFENQNENENENQKYIL